MPQAGPWYTCEVQEAGAMEDGHIAINLKQIEGQFAHWFRAVPVMQKEMLATALTAISTRRRVSVYLPDGTAEGKDISRLNILGY